MAKEVRIDLLDPKLDHDEQRIEFLMLREPRAHEYFSHGVPWTRVDRPDGSVIMIERPEVIKAYLDVCVEERARPILNSLSLSDADFLKETLLGFFVDARRRRSTSSPARSSSPSSASTPTDSAG